MFDAVLNTAEACSICLRGEKTVLRVELAAVDYVTADTLLHYLVLQDAEGRARRENSPLLWIILNSYFDDTPENLVKSWEELAEVSVRAIRGRRGLWFACNFAATLGSNLPVLLLQCLAMAELGFFAIHVLGSALGGLAAASAYYFLCLNHVLPGILCLTLLDRLPGACPGNWAVFWSCLSALIFWGLSRR